MNKELKSLKRIRKLLEDKYGLLIYVDDLDIIETALKDYERRLELAKEYKDVNNVAKRLLALEIIKEKQVNIFILLHNGDLETYNDMVEKNRKLTQEEYDLLKEVLL